MTEIGQLNILLVEDNQLNVMLIKSLFSESKLKLQVAENGSIGIDKIKENIILVTKIFTYILAVFICNCQIFVIKTSSISLHAG